MHKLSISIILAGLLCWLSGSAMADKDELLQPDDAFRLNYSLNARKAVELSWDIADGYYLYRHKIRWIPQTPGIEAGIPSMPAGRPKHDPFFGEVEIYRDHLKIELPVQRKDPALTRFDLEVTFQGCADAGVCYLPIRKTLTFDLPKESAAEAGSSVPPDPHRPFFSEQDRIAAVFSGGSKGWIVMSFLGFGLLLAFTPCVFPMIPIISGIIVGHGAGLTTRKAFGLSLCYVLASAVTYTLFGILAGLFGKNLQALFQQPWAIIGVSLVFVLLALSTFGFFNLQIPSFIQTRATAASSRQRRGSWISAAAMGMLSALAIGPCVTAPLAGALIYIGQSGDAALGGLALFSLGIGMGIPLLVIGTSAGRLMPRAGPWMHVTRSVFGVGLLAVAVWLLGRILPLEAALSLWGLLLTIPMLYLGWKRLWKICGILALTYGILLLTGVATRQQRDYLGFLCNVAVACQAPPTLVFGRISTAGDLERSLAEAGRKNQWVMLEFYADWCVTCQELKHTTFSDAGVQKALSDFLLVQADVTEENQPARSLMQSFELIGPPAILFFGPDQQERKPYRIIGYMNSRQFLAQLQQMKKS